MIFLRQVCCTNEMRLGEGKSGAFEHEALRFVIDVNIVVQYVSKFFFSTPDTP